MAAVIGREFDFRLLPALLDSLSESRLLEVLDEALAAHVLEELTAGSERYQFSHVLIQQTLAEGVSPSRRVRLHARIAQALETLYRDALEAHAAELAYHYAQAEPVLGTEKLVRYAVMAGEHALATSAYEEAMTHFQRGLAAKAGQPMDSATALLLFGLGRAQSALGAAQDAWTTLGRAFDYCEAAGDVALAVTIAEYPLLVVPGLQHITRLVERALALVPPESRQAGQLLARYGLLLNLETGDHTRTQAARSVPTWKGSRPIAALGTDPVHLARTFGQVQSEAGARVKTGKQSTGKQSWVYSSGAI